MGCQDRQPQAVIRAERVALTAVEATAVGDHQGTTVNVGDNLTVVRAAARGTRAMPSFLANRRRNGAYERATGTQDTGGGGIEAQETHRLDRRWYHRAASAGASDTVRLPGLTGELTLREALPGRRRTPARGIAATGEAHPMARARIAAARERSRQPARTPARRPRATVTRETKGQRRRRTKPPETAPGATRVGPANEPANPCRIPEGRRPRSCSRSEQAWSPSPPVSTRSRANTARVGLSRGRLSVLQAGNSRGGALGP